MMIKKHSIKGTNKVSQEKQLKTIQKTIEERKRGKIMIKRMRKQNDRRRISKNKKMINEEEKKITKYQWTEENGG